MARFAVVSCRSRGHRKKPRGSINHGIHPLPVKACSEARRAARRLAVGTKTSEDVPSDFPMRVREVVRFAVSIFLPKSSRTDLYTSVPVFRVAWHHRYNHTPSRRGPCFVIPEGILRGATLARLLSKNVLGILHELYGNRGQSAP